MSTANLSDDARPTRLPWGARYAWLAAASFLALVGAGAVMTTGCDSSPCNTDPDANPAVDFHGGEVEGSGDGMVYETSPPDGSHLNFSAGTRYKIYHQLSGRPQIVQPWVSFSSNGTTTGNEAVPAGNMVEILEVNDQFVHLQNNSCADYWLRLVAAAPSKVPSPPK